MFQLDFPGSDVAMLMFLLVATNTSGSKSSVERAETSTDRMIVVSPILGQWQNDERRVGLESTLVSNSVHWLSVPSFEAVSLE